MAKTPRKAIPQPSVTEEQRLIAKMEAAKREWSLSHFIRSALVRLIQESWGGFETTAQIVSKNITANDTVIIHNIYVSIETRAELDQLREKIGEYLGKRITMSAMIRASIDNFSRQ